MLKIIQIIRYMKSQNYTKIDIYKELTFIVNNGHSNLFDLSLNDIVNINKIYINDDKLKSVFNITME